MAAKRGKRRAAKGADVPRRLDSLRTLLRASGQIQEALDCRDILQKVAEAARELTGARTGACGHGFADGAFRVEAASADMAGLSGPAPEDLRPAMGQAYMELAGSAEPIRLTKRRARVRTDVRGPGESPRAARRLLGARLVGRDGAAGGLILVADKAEDGDFTAEDESLLRQLAAIASLALHHLEALNQARKAAEEARSLARFPEENPNPVLRVAGDGTLMYANPAAMELRDWRLAVGQPLPRPIGRLVGQALEKGEASCESPSGDRVFWLMAAPIPAECYVNIYGRDITERKAAEQALRQAKQHAEDVAGELARSNKELEQFAYIASHDLQEPLRMVTAFMGRVEERYASLLDEKGKKYVGFAVEGARRMSQLINDLLEYSRVQSRPREPAAVDMKAVFERAVANCAAGIREAGASVTRGELPTLVGDESPLIQLLQNLIGNAMKFRRPDVRPEVLVTACREGGEWVFSVRDNGIGFPMEQAERIFLIFQRLHARDKYPGTGIGLAVCRKIVERHGGRMWSDSRVGEGSTFHFTLPAGP